MERYGKAFPHRAGKVKGCHSGPDGQARDGIARPGCHCRACDVTNSGHLAESGNGWSVAQLQYVPGNHARQAWPGWMGKDWETAYAAHQGNVEGATP